MALSKSERLEIQASAATNVKRRVEEERLREQQKQDMETFVKETEAKMLAEAQSRKEEARDRAEKNTEKAKSVSEPVAKDESSQKESK